MIENPLVADQTGDYRMNLEHLDNAPPEAKVLLLCSPHNPVGRVWREAELVRCWTCAPPWRWCCRQIRDLTYPDKPAHRVLATLADGDDALITAVAPSKTFNMPGLGLSALVIPDPERRKAMKSVFDRLHLPQCNPFSIAGFEAGYRHGGPWRDDLMAYLQGNRDFLVQEVNRRLPGIRTSAEELQSGWTVGD